MVLRYLSFRQAKLAKMAGGGRVDVLDSEREFAFVAAAGAALFGAAISENTPRYGAVRRVEGEDPAVSEIGGHDRRLAIMEFGEAGLGIDVDERLPIDLANPLSAYPHGRCPARRKAQDIRFRTRLVRLSRQSELQLPRRKARWRPEPTQGVGKSGSTCY
jgi:hypothetical protein